MMNVTWYIQCHGNSEQNRRCHPTSVQMENASSPSEPLKRHNASEKCWKFRFAIFSYFARGKLPLAAHICPSSNGVGRQYFSLSVFVCIHGSRANAPIQTTYDAIYSNFFFLFHRFSSHSHPSATCWSFFFALAFASLPSQVVIGLLGLMHVYSRLLSLTLSYQADVPAPCPLCAPLSRSVGICNPRDATGRARMDPVGYFPTKFNCEVN